MESPIASPSRFDRWSGYVIASSVLLVLAGHVSMTLVYLSPPNIAQEHLGSLANGYIKPLFSQNWHLFSPNPGVTTRKFALRCEADGQWSEWFDPIAGLIAEHNANRFSGVGKLLYLYRAIGDDLRDRVKVRMIECHRRRSADKAATPLPEAEERDAISIDDLEVAAEECSADNLMDEIVATAEFDLAMRYAGQVCGAWAEEQSSSASSLQFKLLEFFPLEYGDRAAAEAEGRHWKKVHELVFPILVQE
jgi:hypothetical protein